MKTMEQITKYIKCGDLVAAKRLATAYLDETTSSGDKAQRLVKMQSIFVYRLKHDISREGLARMEAAAPELLAALNTVNTWLIAPDTAPETCAEMRAITRAAIAKARGESL